MPASTLLAKPSYWIVRCRHRVIHGERAVSTQFGDTLTRANLRPLDCTESVSVTLSKSPVTWTTTSVASGLSCHDLVLIELLNSTA